MAPHQNPRYSLLHIWIVSVALIVAIERVVQMKIVIVLSLYGESENRQQYFSANAYYTDLLRHHCRPCGCSSPYSTSILFSALIVVELLVRSGRHCNAHPIRGLSNEHRKLCEIYRSLITQINTQKLVQIAG